MPISGAHVLSILPVREGLLVGTRTGLALMPLDATQTVFDRRLAGQAVAAIAADDTFLWIGTLGHGLIRAECKTASRLYGQPNRPGEE
jgi:hypothetical protein